MTKATLAHEGSGFKIYVDSEEVKGWEIGDIVTNDVTGQEDDDTDGYELICRGTTDCECDNCSDLRG